MRWLVVVLSVSVALASAPTAASAQSARDPEFAPEYVGSTTLIVVGGLAVTSGAVLLVASGLCAGVGVGATASRSTCDMETLAGALTGGLGLAMLVVGIVWSVDLGSHRGAARADGVRLGVAPAIEGLTLVLEWRT